MWSAILGPVPLIKFKCIPTRLQLGNIFHILPSMSMLLSGISRVMTSSLDSFQDP